MAPVVAGMCKMESIYDGSLDLGAFAIMNDALAIKTENEFRARKAAESRETQ